MFADTVAFVLSLPYASALHTEVLNQHLAGEVTLSRETVARIAERAVANRDRAVAIVASLILAEMNLSHGKCGCSDDEICDDHSLAFNLAGRRRVLA